MEHSWLPGPSLEDKDVPEARGESGRDLARGAALEPVKVELLMGV